MKTGIYYDLSNDEYHSGEGVSKSQLDDIAISPAVYQWKKYSPQDVEKIKALDIGTATHTLILEPEKFDSEYIISPNFNIRTNQGKADRDSFLKETLSKRQIIITEDEKQKLMLMRESVLAHPVAKWLVECDGVVESSIYWEDIETKILCKCRPDKSIPKYGWIADLKTIADIDRFQRSVYEYRYHVQDAFYSDGYNSHYNECPTFVFIAVSTSINCGRYPVRVFQLDPEARSIGKATYRENLLTLKECQQINEWPGIETISLPYWAKELRND